MSQIDSASVAKKHQEIRDKAIEQKLKEAIAFLDAEQLKQSLLQKVVNKYRPDTEEVDSKIEFLLNEKIKDITKDRIEEIISTSLESVFNNKLNLKISEMVDEEMDNRFKNLIKYNDEY